jgi:hypothetical protein
MTDSERMVLLRDVVALYFEGCITMEELAKKMIVIITLDSPKE